jgi:molecular chaperone DnaK (HSP70)
LHFAGGTSQILYVQQKIKQTFEGYIYHDKDPDTAISQGACLYHAWRMRQLNTLSKRWEVNILYSILFYDLK